MSITALGYIADILSDGDINYEFGQWSSTPVPYPYWVGEYTESEAINEDGMQETTFILTGTTRVSWYELEQDKEKIEKLFKNATAILPNNNGIAGWYSDALIVPVDDMELKRMQINLSINEWKVV